MVVGIKEWKSPSSYLLSPVRIGIWNVGLCGGKKTGGPGKRPSEQELITNQ